MSVTHRVTIEALGRDGDGIVRIGDRTLYLPYYVPGDVLDLDLDVSGHDVDRRLISASSHAVSPACTLFSRCGGCALQRLSFSDQLSWKVSRVRDALKRAGFHPSEPTSVHQSPPLSRRRVDLAVVKTSDAVVIGLHQRKNAPVDMTSCHLLTPRIFDLLEPLRRLVWRLGAISHQADLHINHFDTGADIVIRVDAAPSPSDRRKIADFAAAHQIPRISWLQSKTYGKSAEVIAQWGPVKQDFSGIIVAPPPGAFMQATASGEHAIITAVCNALPKLNKRDRITELYSGMGTLTLPLSAFGFVDAYEGHAPAISALDAVRSGRRISSSVRDLARQPLQHKDFEKSRVVVMDPPRMGAGTQAERVASSSIKEVIYVSCNPIALQNDLAPFAQRGYELLSWSVIDQFLWSVEAEAVIALTLDRKRWARRQA